MTVVAADGRTLLSVYDERVISYQEALLRSQQHSIGNKTDADAIHDLRVSIRRLLALLDIIRKLYPRLPRCRKLHRRLKAQLSSLGGLRDTQVMLAGVRQWKMSCAGQAFALWLFRREKRLLESALVALQLFEDKQVRGKLTKVRRKLEAEVLAGDQSSALWELVSSLRKDVLTCNCELSQGDVRGIHRLRIAFKRFRYSVEVAEAVAPQLPSAFFHWMREWQTLLGNVQDVVVMEENARYFFVDRLNFDDFALLEQVVRQREQYLERFWQQRQDLAGFQLPVE